MYFDFTFYLFYHLPWFRTSRPALEICISLYMRLALPLNTGAISDSHTDLSVECCTLKCDLLLN